PGFGVGDDGVAEGSQPGDGEESAWPIEARRGRVTGLGHVARSCPDHRHRQRQRQEEDRPPPETVDEQATYHWPDHGGDAGQARPGADRSRPVVGMETRLEDGEAAWGEEGSADALEDPG